MQTIQKDQSVTEKLSERNKKLTEDIFALKIWQKRFGRLLKEE